MKHLDCVVWLLLFPLVQSICKAIEYNWCKSETFSKETEGFAATLLLIFYIWVAVKLY